MPIHQATFDRLRTAKISGDGLATLNHKLIHGDCLEVLRTLDEVTCLFADPPDNIGLGYNEFDDKQPDDAYVAWLGDCLRLFIQKASIVWVSYNARWSFARWA